MGEVFCELGNEHFVCVKVRTARVAVHWEAGTGDGKVCVFKQIRCHGDEHEDGLLERSTV
jgi:hypothetical protein